MRVQEIIDDTRQTWDVEQLAHFLLPNDVRRVLQTPLPPGGFMDRLVWQQIEVASILLNQATRGLQRWHSITTLKWKVNGTYFGV